jgi:DNA-binding MarR family transcriptional regulator
VEMGFGKTETQYAALRSLFFAPGHRITQVELGNQLSITSPSVTALADTLESNGLAIRVPHETDRRTTYVQLTEQGMAVCEQLVPGVAALNQELAACFSETEQMTLIMLINRFLAHAAELQGTPLLPTVSAGSP